MATAVETKKGIDWTRLLILLVFGLAGLAVIGWNGMEWRNYRREVRRPGVERRATSIQSESRFSRFPAVELRNRNLNVFHMGRIEKVKANLLGGEKRVENYQIIGVVKRGSYMLVVRRGPDNRLAWVRTGEEIVQGVVVAGVSPASVTIRQKDGSLREHPVFELRDSASAESLKRSRQ